MMEVIDSNPIVMQLEARELPPDSETPFPSPGALLLRVCPLD